MIIWLSSSQRCCWVDVVVIVSMTLLCTASPPISKVFNRKTIYSKLQSDSDSTILRWHSFQQQFIRFFVIHQSSTLFDDCFFSLHFLLLFRCIDFHLCRKSISIKNIDSDDDQLFSIHSTKPRLLSNKAWPNIPNMFGN